MTSNTTPVAKPVNKRTNKKGKAKRTQNDYTDGVTDGQGYENLGVVGQPIKTVYTKLQARETILGVHETTAQQTVPKKRRCSRTACIVIIVLCVIFALIIVGLAIGIPLGLISSSKKSSDTTVTEPILMILGLNTEQFHYPVAKPTIYRINLHSINSVNISSFNKTSIGLETAACVSQNSLYAVGLGEGYNETWRWSATGDDWERLADLPLSRYRHCAVSVSDKIYVLGGRVYHGNNASNKILRYDINSKKWTEVTPLQRAVDSMACATYNNLIFVFSGYDVTGNSEDSYFQVYDTENDKSSSLFGTAQPLMRAVVWNSIAILIGYRDCFIYDFESNRLQARTRFAVGNIHFGLTLYNDTLYLSGGGSNNEPGLFVRSNQVLSLAVRDFISDNSTAGWKNFATLPEPALVHAFNAEPLYA